MTAITDVRNHAFYKKSKSGTFVKVVREHYLRDDIPCGSLACDKCLSRQTLDAVPLRFSTIIDKPYYVMLDTNVILANIDVIEDALFTNVIILQTVLNEVRHRSIPIFKRLRDLIDQKRRFFVFVNEFCDKTYSDRVNGETPNDYSDRLIRISAEYYNNHLKKVHTILLSDDVDNRKRAESLGVKAFSLKDFVSHIESNSELLDKISSNASKRSNLRLKLTYPEHLPLSKLKIGLKTGKYMQGTYQASRYNFLEGHVFVEDKQLYIQGRDSINRAMQDDLVVVEMLPEDEWIVPATEIKEDETKDIDDTPQLDDDEEAAVPVKKKKKKKNAAPSCKVVGIIKRNWRQYCGILEKTTLKGGVNHLFKPADSRFPKIRIETRQYDVLLGCRIVVAIDSWPRDSKYPLGHYVRNLGKVGDKDTENEVLLLEHDVPHQPFSDKVLACLPKVPWSISAEERAKRLDLTDVDICSIDPPGCTDIDDALHCREIGDGMYEVGVHIADVSHFIRPNTAIDEEAAKRGTTVYLTDNRIDMVPALLSSNLCSLRGGEERLAFSVLWQIDSDANIKQTHFSKSVIRSRRAFTYFEAQLLIDDSSAQDNIAKSLRVLNGLAKKLKSRRLDQGALLLASPEIRFHIDSETNDPIEVQTKELMDTNSLVEEFMLLANISTAKKTYEHFSECACLRRHPAPPPSNFEVLIKAARSKGIEIDATSAKKLAESFEGVAELGNAKLDILLRILATRCMMQAVYFASGFIPEADFVHYGLATPIYTHFTSPIRRYADIIVHRLLAVAIEADSSYPALLDPKHTQTLCNNINFRHKMAQYAQRASVHLHTELYFRTRVEDCTGHVLYVRRNGLVLLILKYGLEGIMYLPKDTDFDEDEPSQTVKGHKFTIFDELTVQVSVDRTDEQHPKVQIHLVRPVIEGFSVPPLDADYEPTHPEKKAVVKKRKSNSKSPAPGKKTK